MTKQEQIEEMAEAVICASILANAKIDDKVAINLKEFIDNLYNAGYRKVPDGAVIIPAEERDEEIERFKEENAKLKAENASLRERLDRSVELPCKVDDIVYKKDGAWTVVGFDCNLVNSWKVKLERWKNKYLDEHETTKVVFSSFGKTVFFTEEEARLKELQERDK